MQCPCMPIASPSGHSSVKLGVLTTACRRRCLKSPGVWHQIIYYDGARERLGGKDSYQAKVAKAAKLI